MFQISLSPNSLSNFLIVIWIISLRVAEKINSFTPFCLCCGIFFGGGGGTLIPGSAFIQGLLLQKYRVPGLNPGPLLASKHPPTSNTVCCSSVKNFYSVGIWLPVHSLYYKSGIHYLDLLSLGGGWLHPAVLGGYS